MRNVRVLFPVIFFYRFFCVGNFRRPKVFFPLGVVALSFFLYRGGPIRLCTIRANIFFRFRVLFLVRGRHVNLFTAGWEVIFPLLFLGALRLFTFMR